MNSPCWTEPEANPFATRWTRPGALPFSATAHADPAGVLHRIESGGWRGQIVGPHGVGKSTLVAELIRRLLSRGVDAVSLSASAMRRATPSDPCVVFVEGIERAGWRALPALAARIASRRPLVVTSHRPRIAEAVLGLLPIVARLAPDEAAFLSLYDRLVADRPARVDRREAARRFAEAGGNFREAWFALYDLHEARRGRTGSVAVTYSAPSEPPSAGL